MKRLLVMPILLTFWALFVCLGLIASIWWNSEVLAAITITIAILPFIIDAFIFQRHWLIIALLLSLPISVAISIGGGKIMAPSELLLILLVVATLLFGRADVNIIRHPLTILLILELVVFAIGTLFSTMPLISLKRTITHSLYIFCGVFIVSEYFVKKNTGWLMYFFPTLFVVVAFVNYSLFMMQFNWSSQVVNDAPQPFFTDHTVFGAYVAFLVPAPIWFALGTRWKQNEKWKQLGWLFIGILVLTVAILSFSRAVWLSLAAMLFCASMLRLKIPFTAIVGIACVLLAALFFNSNKIQNMLTQNKARSGIADISIQVKSISNISSDVSNLERINRWKSAWQMFLHKPHLGFGPGTYQFQYASYQNLRNKTPISTNFGDKGNAHSEWLMYLSETGWPGLLLFVCIAVGTLWRGFYIFRHATQQHYRLTAAIAVTALFGYLVHGTVNSFLEVDKIALLFYGSIGLIISIDLRLFYTTEYG